ncbi:MAG: CBS domain-containing protein [Acidiferrobacterales bacterium]
MYDDFGPDPEVARVISINEIMTTELHTLSQTDSLQTAIKLMAKKHIRHIPIVTGKGELVGLVTHRDVLAATDSTLRAKSEHQNPASVPLSTVMTRDVVTVDEHVSLRSAALYLEQHKYGCLPVVTDGKLRGIITDSDFVAVVINLLEQLEAIEPPSDYEEGEPSEEY